MIKAVFKHLNISLIIKILWVLHGKHCQMTVEEKCCFCSRLIANGSTVMAIQDIINRANKLGIDIVIIAAIREKKNIVDVARCISFMMVQFVLVVVWH